MVQIFLVSHMKFVRNQKYLHHPKLILKTVFDSKTYVGIMTILRLGLFYISRNWYTYETNVYTAGVNKVYYINLIIHVE
jgi:hypothetical protein